MRREWWTVPLALALGVACATPARRDARCSEALRHFHGASEVQLIRHFGTLPDHVDENGFGRALLFRVPVGIPAPDARRAPLRERGAPDAGGAWNHVFRSNELYTFLLRDDAVVDANAHDIRRCRALTLRAERDAR